MLCYVCCIFSLVVIRCIIPFPLVDFSLRLSRLHLANRLVAFTASPSRASYCIYRVFSYRGRGELIQTLKMRRKQSRCVYRLPIAGVLLHLPRFLLSGRGELIQTPKMRRKRKIGSGAPLTPIYKFTFLRMLIIFS